MSTETQISWTCDATCCQQPSVLIKNLIRIRWHSRVHQTALAKILVGEVVERYLYMDVLAYHNHHLFVCCPPGPFSWCWARASIVGFNISLQPSAMLSALHAWSRYALQQRQGPLSQKLITCAVGPCGCVDRNPIGHSWLHQTCTRLHAYPRGWNPNQDKDIQLFIPQDMASSIRDLLNVHGSASLLLPADEMIIGEELGRGATSIVHRGTLRGKQASVVCACVLAVLSISGSVCGCSVHGCRLHVNIWLVIWKYGWSPTQISCRRLGLLNAKFDSRVCDLPLEIGS